MTSTLFVGFSVTYKLAKVKLNRRLRKYLLTITKRSVVYKAEIWDCKLFFLHQRCIKMNSRKTLRKREKCLCDFFCIVLSEILEMFIWWCITYYFVVNCYYSYSP
jgi:hypothetical protein